MNAVRLAVLRGTLYADNPLSLLRGNALVWTAVFGLVDAWCQQHLDRSAASPWRSVVQWRRFPEPRGVVVNMMPVDLTRLSATVPDFLTQYIPLILDVV